MTDVFVYYEPKLPLKCSGLTCENPDGSFTILINPNLCYEAQKQAYKHELKHIESDYGKRLNVAQMESDAHKL